ncbi:hypothetical protein D3C80_2008980 [compost metagenome]
MAVQAELHDVNALQRLAHLLDDFGTLRAQFTDVVTEQHLVGKAKFPTVIGQFEPLRLQ